MSKNVRLFLIFNFLFSIGFSIKNHPSKIENDFEGAKIMLFLIQKTFFDFFLRFALIKNRKSKIENQKSSTPFSKNCLFQSGRKDTDFFHHDKFF